LQLITIEELLVGQEVKLPPTAAAFKQAPKIRKVEGTQGELGI
jgi:hypothetical protein